MEAKLAIELLTKQIERANALKRVPDFPLDEFRTWRSLTRNILERYFGFGSVCTHEFDLADHSDHFIQMGSGPEEWDRILKDCIEDLIKKIESSIEIVQLDLIVVSHDKISHWDIIHPVIVSVSQRKYLDGHYADSVESALKEINHTIKVKVREISGLEYDGVSLMRKAFGIPNTILKFESDLNSDTGKSIQEGYMQIFAGAMMGIRNPKAHANIQIDKNRALHFLFLSSLLMFKIDELV